MRTRYFILLALAGGVLIAIVAGAGQALQTRTLATLDPMLRTIVVVTKADSPPLLQGEDIAVDLETGNVPVGVMRAMVLTDTNCAPDDKGVSHCLNEMQAERMRFTVRHNHKMMEEPCFSPTEELNVVDVATYTAIETTRQ